MDDDVETQVARTAALALHAQALLERTSGAPPSPTREANLDRLERAVGQAQAALQQLAAQPLLATP